MVFRSDQRKGLERGNLLPKGLKAGNGCPESRLKRIFCKKASLFGSRRPDLFEGSVSDCPNEEIPNSVVDCLKLDEFRCTCIRNSAIRNNAILINFEW